MTPQRLQENNSIFAVRCFTFWRGVACCQVWFLPILDCNVCSAGYLLVLLFIRKEMCMFGASRTWCSALPVQLAWVFLVNLVLPRYGNKLGFWRESRVCSVLPKSAWVRCWRDAHHEKNKCQAKLTHICCYKSHECLLQSSSYGKSRV
jgi:hypothetical protein